MLNGDLAAACPGERHQVKWFHPPVLTVGVHGKMWKKTTGGALTGTSAVTRLSESLIIHIFI